jgi:site-specific DNA-cytosine methylase
MRTIELFAGGGGAAMGLHRAGFHTLARCEWDKDACATLRAAADAGFLDAADVIEGDVRAVDWSPYVGKVDVLWASPPCQAWSSAGKRLGASDDRNGWPWTWDVADAVRPTWLLAENVTGLLMHRGDCDGSGEPESCPACYFHRHILPEAERRFASVQWAVLNSSSYGVPQHRRRVYLVCGPRPIAWPKATHGDPAEIRQGGLFAPALLPWRTVREALNLDAALRPERGQGMQERHGVRRDHPATEPAPQIGAGSAGSGPRLQVVADTSIVYRRGREAGAVDETHGVDEPSCALRGALFVLDPKHPPVDPDGLATAIRSGGSGHSAPPMWLRTEMTGAGAAPVDVPAGPVPKLGNQYLHGRDPGVRNGPATRPELLDCPSPTVSAVGECKGSGEGGNPDKMQRASDALFLGAGIRRLTVTECALLMAWPADYPLQGTKTSQYRIVGNGCTPPVVELLARAVIAAGRHSP